MSKKPKTTPPLLSTPLSETGPVADVCLVLKVPEFGSRYQVTRQTVWVWLKCGLPHIKVGKRALRIPIKDADRWVSEKLSRRHERQ